LERPYPNASSSVAAPVTRARTGAVLGPHGPEKTIDQTNGQLAYAKVAQAGKDLAVEPIPIRLQRRGGAI
jgi:hypothetical protein